ncbi:MAG: ribonuclease P protein component 3 [Methanobrevibacter sp.]
MIFYDLNLKGSDYNNDYNLIKEAYNFGWNYLNLQYSPEEFQNALDYKDKLIEDISSFTFEDKPLEINFGLSINSSNVNTVRKTVNRFRNRSDFISVFGGVNEINRASLENRHVDVLSRPYYKKSDCGLNHVLAKEAFKNQVAIELCFKDILTNFLSYRAKVLANFRDIIALQRKFEFPLIITTGSENIFDIRSPIDISNFFKVLGLNDQEIRNGLMECPKSIVDFNKNRENFLFEGVHIVNRDD